MAIEGFTTGGERKNGGNKNKNIERKGRAQAWNAKRIALRKGVLFPLD